MSDVNAPEEKKPQMSSNWGLGRSYPDRYPIDVFSYTRARPRIAFTRDVS
jgi:hypothetical protein